MAMLSGLGELGARRRESDEVQFLEQLVAPGAISVGAGVLDEPLRILSELRQSPRRPTASAQSNSVPTGALACLVQLGWIERDPAAGLVITSRGERVLDGLCPTKTE